MRVVIFSIIFCLIGISLSTSASCSNNSTPLSNNNVVLPYINTPYFNTPIIYKRGEFIQSTERMHIINQYANTVNKIIEKNSNNNIDNKVNNDLLIQIEILKYKVDFLEKELNKKDLIIQELIKK